MYYNSFRVLPMPFDGPEVVHLPPSRDGSMPSVFFVNNQRPKERYYFTFINTEKCTAQKPKRKLFRII